MSDYVKAIVRRGSIKKNKCFENISQNSQENNCSDAFFLIDFDAVDLQLH